MRIVADLHIHSKYSRACSRDLELPKIAGTCATKGIDLVATGDFTHPAWFAAIEKELEEDGSSGLYRLCSGGIQDIRFVLSTELALIYKDGDRTRRLHIMVQAPDLASAKTLNDQLGRRFNLKSDGRPILGLPANDLVKLCLSIHPHFLVYPAHIWTPWFSVFGSKSGYDSLADCFKDQAEHIFAYETGLSSDPEMNWRVSQLDSLTLLSNSDAHSLPNLGRECNIFDLPEVSYEALYQAIRNKTGMDFTLEFYPEEGMYHFDGHRDCAFSSHPIETAKHGGICPVCKKPLVIGVLSRVGDLAERPEGFVLPGAPGFKKLIELDKIIAAASGVKSRSSRKVQEMYALMIGSLGSELEILLEKPIDQIAAVANDVIAEGVRRVRSGELIIKPGFDGQYGEVSIFNEDETPGKGQKRLF
ncbi:DNA helicase UvrD [Candidatus Falkowbacteria bacterium]|nr:DNA helicase UvrD [Candidatus Falkowbacteria bacterium]